MVHIRHRLAFFHDLFRVPTRREFAETWIDFFIVQLHRPQRRLFRQVPRLAHHQHVAEAAGIFPERLDLLVNLVGRAGEHVAAAHMFFQIGAVDRAGTRYMGAAQNACGNLRRMIARRVLPVLRHFVRLHVPHQMVGAFFGRTLVVAETLRLGLTAFDVAPDGALSNRRIWASTAAQGVAPDGICTDGEIIWAASALAPLVVGYREGGEVAGTVATQQNAYACALGGSDGKSLFIMTAPSSHPGEIAGVESGSIEVAQLD